MKGKQMKLSGLQDLKLVSVNEEVNHWVRDIYFEFNGEEQYVKLRWEEGNGYEIIKEELTNNFRKALDAWHETTDELFESMLDDLTWDKING